MSFGLTSGYGNNMRQKQILEEIRRLNCEYFVSIAQYHQTQTDEIASVHEKLSLKESEAAKNESIMHGEILKLNQQLKDMEMDK